MTGDEQIDVDKLTEVPIFPQQGSGLAEVLGTADTVNPQSEDAFFLNVWAPEDAHDLPVLFFVHGGAWTSGGGSIQWYDGRHLAARGLVVVTVNYRLGPVAHLDHARIGDQLSPSRPVQDLVTALRWVGENIQRFGGAPDRITIAGHSTGGWYVHLLSVLEESRDSFDRVALLSMSTRPPRSPSFQEQIRAIADEILAPADAESAPIPDLLDAGNRALAAMLGPAPFGYVPAAYVPHVSGNVPAELLEPSWAARNCSAKAVYARYTADETGTFFHGSPTLRSATEETVQEWLCSLPTGSLSAQLQHNLSISGASPYEKVVAASSWLQYQRVPTLLTAAYKAAGIPSALHVFDYQGAVDGQLSGHCIDLPFQFGTYDEWSDAPMMMGWDREDFSALSSELIGELVEFVA